MIRMHYCCISIFCLWLFVSISHSYAQNTGKVQQELKYSTEQVNNLNFSTSTINNIAQDQTGFMWFGTWAGLFMYDGYQVRTYKFRPGYQSCFKGRKIRVVYSDSKGRLWVGGTLSGLHLYDENTQCFRQFIADPDDESSIPENDIMAIWEDADSTIWIATTYGYVSKLDIQENGQVEFENYYYEEGVDFLSATHSGEAVWLGTTEGVVRFVMNEPLQKGKSNFSKIKSADSFVNNTTINSILFDPHENHTLWLGTTDGIKKLTISSGEKQQQTDTYYIQPSQKGGIENRIKTIHQSNENPGQLWIGTDEGAYRFNKSDAAVKDFSVLEEGEITDKVTRFYEDDTGVIWIGTNKGIKRVNKFRKEFNYIAIGREQVEASGEIRAIDKNSNDHLFVGTHGLGILKLRNDAESNSSESFHKIQFDEENLGSNFINSIGIDKEDHIWAGTDGSGLYKVAFDNDEMIAKQVTHYVHNEGGHGLSDNFIYSMFSDSRGNFWIGTYQGGLNRYRERDDNFILYDKVDGINNELSAYPIVKITEDHQGRIWLGTRGNGVYIFTPENIEIAGTESFRRMSSENGLLDNFITDIFEDGNRRMWIGTEAGLSMYDPDKESFASYSRANGFPADVVQSIQGHLLNELWISTAKGIVRMNVDSSMSKPEVIDYKEYDFSDGLGNEYFNNNVALESDGIMYFGGLSGLTYFKPEEINVNPHQPSIVLTDFELNHKSVPIGKMNGRTILEKDINNVDQIVLNHSDNVLTFEFSALHYASPEKNNYAYMMEGFDQDWINTNSNRRYAHYTNLSHGEYTFKVKASNNDGVWNEQSKSVKVIVLPPFWLTPWAFILYVLVVVAALYMIRKITLMRANLKHKIQLERLEREKADELHNIELQYFTNISHEIRTPLTLILSPLEKILKEEDLSARINNQLNLMHHHGVRLFRLLNQLLDFRKQGRGKMRIKAAEGDFIKFVKEIYISFRESAIERNIAFSFNNAFDSQQLYYDRDILEKVLYNLLSNAFKYTGEAGNIDINVLTKSHEDVKGLVNSEFAEYNEIFEQQYLTIQVKDDGPGISSADLRHIFERFYQAKNQSAISVVGTGIGLSLTKELVLLHKGVLSVASEEGKGTIFSIHLPLGKDHLSSDEVITDFKDSENQSHYQFLSAYPGKKKESTLKGRSTSAENAKLLLVEDNEDVRNLIKSILSNEYEIIQAANGKEGVDLAIREVPDLIISDVMMPEMDGMELCSMVKKDERTSHIPVILLTARTRLIFKVEGVESGADDYITKPFSPEYLEARVRNLIEQRKRLKRQFNEKLYLKPKDIALNSLDETFLNKMIELVNENMSDSEYGIDQLCKDLGMSRIQLYRKLKALTGQSANEFIRTQRLQRAAQLLKQNQLTIAQVTYEVGFNDLKYFRTRFSEHFGMTPSDFISKHKDLSKEASN